MGIARDIVEQFDELDEKQGTMYDKVLSAKGWDHSQVPGHFTERIEQLRENNSIDQTSKALQKYGWKMKKSGKDNLVDELEHPQFKGEHLSLDSNNVHHYVNGKRHRSFSHDKIHAYMKNQFGWG